MQDWEKNSQCYVCCKLKIQTRNCSAVTKFHKPFVEKVFEQYSQLWRDLSVFLCDRRCWASVFRLASFFPQIVHSNFFSMFMCSLWKWRSSSSWETKCRLQISHARSVMSETIVRMDDVALLIMSSATEDESVGSMNSRLFWAQFLISWS